jgi:hypothetical protein
MDQLYSICMVGFILILTSIEKKRLNSIITPFILAAWPFLFTSLLNNFVLIHFGYSPITARAQVFIMINLFIIWLVGYTMYFFICPIHRDHDIDRYKPIFKDIANYQYFIIFISWITILLNINRVYDLLLAHGGIMFMGDQRFEDKMSGGGNIVGHFVEVGKICYLLLIFTLSYAKNKYLYYVTIIALLFSTAFIMVKYHVMWLILFAFLFYVINKPIKKQLKTVVGIIVVLFLVMNLFWISMTLFWGTFSFTNTEVWNFFIRQFLGYFVAGPIILDNWLVLGDIKPDWALFIVLINVNNVLMGNPVRINAVPYVSHGFTMIAPYNYANVGTSFGVYYLIGGYIFSFFIVTLVSMGTYYIFFKSINTKSKVLIFLNLLVLTLSTFNFFVQYFTLLTTYEVTLLFVLFIVFFKVLDIARGNEYAGIKKI